MTCPKKPDPDPKFTEKKTGSEIYRKTDPDPKNRIQIRNLPKNRIRIRALPKTLLIPACSIAVHLCTCVPMYTCVPVYLCTCLPLYVR